MESEPQLAKLPKDSQTRVIGGLLGAMGAIVLATTTLLQEASPPPHAPPQKKKTDTAPAEPTDIMLTSTEIDPVDSADPEEEPLPTVWELPDGEIALGTKLLIRMQNGSTSTLVYSQDGKTLFVNGHPCDTTADAYIGGTKRIMVRTVVKNGKRIEMSGVPFTGFKVPGTSVWLQEGLEELSEAMESEGGTYSFEINSRLSSEGTITRRKLPPVEIANQEGTEGSGKVEE